MILQEKIGRFHKLWVLCVIVSYLSLNYAVSRGRWLSMIGTGLIVLFSYLSWPNRFKQLLGIPVKVKQYFAIIISLPVIFALIYWLISYISSLNNIGIISRNIFRLDHIFFYTLNEELILGALLLFSLKNKFNKLNPLFISIGIAFIFSAAHYIMYRWIFEVHTAIDLLTLASLLLIGVLRNNLILKTGHIGYSWALHLCWINIMLGFSFYYKADNYFVSEIETFYIFIGNRLTFAIAFTLASLSAIWLLLNKDINFRQYLVMWKRFRRQS